MRVFKDKCDGCGKYRVLKGFQEKCLCKKCRNELKIIDKSTIKQRVTQLSIFDHQEANKWN